MKEDGYSIQFEMRCNYLYTYLAGTDSFDASLEYWEAIALKAQKMEHPRVLVHENLKGQVSEGELFNVMQDIIPKGAGIKVAFFDENQADADINELGQLVAQNRGADIRIFQTLEDAETWISQ